MVAQVRVIVGASAAVFLCACEPDREPADSAEPYVAPLAPAWLAVTGSTYDGAFKSTCTVHGDIFDAATGDTLATATLTPADGGRWAGVALPELVQVKATLYWDDCENTSDGTGEFPASTFSGGDGDLFVLHYDGVDAGFEWMVQATDHLGGEVHAQFDPEADAAEIAAFTQGLGLSSRVDEADSTFTYLAWTESKSVAEVLGQLSESELFVWGEPTWVEKPAWW